MRPRTPSPRPFFAVVGLLFLLLAVPSLAPSAWAQAEILGGKVEKDFKTEAQIKSRMEFLKKQLAASPDNYRYHFELANLYAESGKEEDAIDSYERALQINPKYIEAMVNLGSLHSDRGELDEAVELFEKALALDPEDCKARSNLGNAYYAQERYPDAMFEYQRAVDLNPKCYSALYNIAVAFADAGIFRDAVKWWKKVEDVAPGTDAARSARENIDLLERFTQPPAPPSSGAKGKP